MINFWNERYREKVFLYGKEPNEFLAQQLQKIQTGKILFPCEEEGRNAVYTTKLGWDTFAFDLLEPREMQFDLDYFQNSGASRLRVWFEAIKPKILG